MADDTYRQRRPIQASELNEPQQPDLMTSFRESIAEVAKDDVAEGEAWHPAKPVPMEGTDFAVHGKVPPQFAAAVQRKQMAKQTEPEEADFPIRKPAPRKKFDARPVNNENLRVTGSDSLEKMIAIANQETGVYEELCLPSKGRFYDGINGPTDGKLHIRQMAGEEEEILATPRFVKSGKAIDMIFNRCLREKKYNTENFLAEDRMFLLVKLRGISYSQDYDVEATCPFTDKKFQYTIPLDMNYEECPDDYGPEDLEDQLPTTGMYFKYRLMTGADEMAINNHRQNKLNFEGASNRSDDTLLYRTALLVEWIAVDGAEPLVEKKEILQLLKKLPMSDISYLRTVTSDPPFGLPKKITINSPYTFEDFDIEFSPGADFFSPKVRKKKNQV